MIDCSLKDYPMLERSTAFTFQFSMQLAIILKHSWTPRVQPVALRTDDIGHKFDFVF